MTNRLKWTTVILGFLLGVSIIAAILIQSLVYGLAALPSASSEFSMEGTFTWDFSGEEQHTLTITRIEGKMDTRLLDLILSID